MSANAHPRLRRLDVGAGSARFADASGSGQALRYAGVDASCGQLAAYIASGDRAVSEFRAQSTTNSSE